MNSALRFKVYVGDTKTYRLRFQVKALDGTISPMDLSGKTVKVFSEPIDVTAVIDGDPKDGVALLTFAAPYTNDLVPGVYSCQPRVVEDVTRRQRSYGVGSLEILPALE